MSVSRTESKAENRPALKFENHSFRFYPRKHFRCHGRYYDYELGAISRLFNGDIKKLRELLGSLDFCISGINKFRSYLEAYKTKPSIMIPANLLSLGIAAVFAWLDYLGSTKMDLSNAGGVALFLLAETFFTVMGCGLSSGVQSTARFFANYSHWKQVFPRFLETLKQLNKIYKVNHLEYFIVGEDLGARLALLQFTKKQLLNELSYYPEARRLAFLCGSHPRLGNQSALNRHFFNNECYERNMRQLIFKILEEEDAAPSPAESKASYILDIAAPVNAPVPERENDEEEPNVVTFHF